MRPNGHLVLLLPVHQIGLADQHRRAKRRKVRAGCGHDIQHAKLWRHGRRDHRREGGHECFLQPKALLLLRIHQRLMLKVQRGQMLRRKRPVLSMHFVAVGRGRHVMRRRERVRGRELEGRWAVRPRRRDSVHGIGRVQIPVWDPHGRLLSKHKGLIRLLLRRVVLVSGTNAHRHTGMSWRCIFGKHLFVTQLLKRRGQLCALRWLLPFLSP